MSRQSFQIWPVQTIYEKKTELLENWASVKWHSTDNLETTSLFYEINDSLAYCHHCTNLCLSPKSTVIFKTRYQIITRLRFIDFPPCRLETPATAKWLWWVGNVRLPKTAKRRAAGKERDDSWGVFLLAQRDHLARAAREAAVPSSQWAAIVLSVCLAPAYASPPPPPPPPPCPSRSPTLLLLFIQCFPPKQQEGQNLEIILVHCGYDVD